MNRFGKGRLLGSVALIVATCLLSACMVARAQMRAGGGQMKGNFDDADVNHDGHVTLQEYQDYTTKRLEASNGRIATKFKQLSPEDQADRLQKRFQKMDHGNKGYLDRQDWNSAQS